MACLSRAPRGAWTRSAVVAATIASLAVLIGCGSSSGEGGSANFTGSGYPGVDAANTRNPSSTIDSSNVSSLSRAWTAGIPGTSNFGSYASTPVIDKGVIYSQDLASNVQALSLNSGEVLWSRMYGQPDEGPNGVVVAGGRVFGATPTEAFALDQKTGKQLWSTVLAKNEHEGIDMAPGYDGGMVYVSTVPLNTTEQYQGGGFGSLGALAARPGRKLRLFHPVPHGLWPNPGVNAGGGVWCPPVFDGKRFMYF